MVGYRPLTYAIFVTRTRSFEGLLEQTGRGESDIAASIPVALMVNRQSGLKSPCMLFYILVSPMRPSTL